MSSACLLPLGWALTMVSPPAEAVPPAAAPEPAALEPAREVAEPAPDVASASVGVEAPAPLAAEVEPPSAAASPTASPVTQDLEPAADAERPGLWHGFEIDSADGKHRMHLGFLGQVRGTLEDARGSDPTGGVQMKLVRPILDASLWRGTVGLRVIPELAGTPSLLDATADVSFHDAATLQVGQFRPWISRGFRTGLNVVGVPGRGRVVDRFRVDRDVGATMRGKLGGGVFEYAVGVFNGAGRGSTALAPSPLVTARVMVVPIGAVPYSQIPYLHEVGRNVPLDRSLGVAIGGGTYTVAKREALGPTHASDTDVPAARVPVRHWGASGDIVVAKGRLFTMAEGFYEYRAPEQALRTPLERAWGVYGQVGVLAWSPYLDVTLRGGVMDDASGTWSSLEPGVSAFLVANHAKIQLSYRRDCLIEHPSEGIDTATLQIQLFI